jgi:hypothetical protein
VKRRPASVSSTVMRRSVNRARSSFIISSTMRSISASVSALNSTMSSMRLRNSGRK